MNSPNSTEVSTERANSAVHVPVLPTGSTTFFSYRYVEYISKLTVYFKLTATVDRNLLSAVGFGMGLKFDDFNQLCDSWPKMLKRARVRACR